MSIEEKLNEYAEIPSNLDLENTMRERNGVPIILCVPLDEAILICKQEIAEACKKAKIEVLQECSEKAIEYQYGKLGGVAMCLFTQDRIKELNAPSPEGE